MDDQIIGARERRRSRRRRAGLPAGAVVGIAVLAAACGGGPIGPGVASIGSTTSTTIASSVSQGRSDTSNYVKSVAYAQCMRAHGEPGFPDPNSQGNFLVGPSNHLAQGSPQYVAANKACAHLLPNGGQATPAELQQALAHALKFSQCMRAHGLPTFPDPVETGGNIEIGIGGKGIGRNSPQLQAAQKACQYLMGAGP